MDPSTQATIDEMLDTEFGGGFVRAKQTPNIPIEMLVEEVGELDETHHALAKAHVESGLPVGAAPTQDLKHIRESHHRVARLLAMGTPDVEAAYLTNYDISRVRYLRTNPAFQELLAYYGGEVKETWSDFVENAAELSKDLMAEVKRRLDEKPEEFTLTMINELLKTTADRSGNAPTTKNINLNVNTGAADRLARARNRLNQATTLDGEVVHASNT